MFAAEMVERITAAAADPAGRSDAELSAVMLDFGRLEAQVLAAKARVTAEWDARRVWAADGAVSGGSWLGHRGEVSRADAHRQVRMARRLAAMPLTTAALDAGEVGTTKAAMLARACRPEVAKAFAGAEAMLVGHAKEFTVDQFGHVLRRWTRVNRPDRDPGDRDRSEVYLSPTYGGVHDLRGRLDGEEGVIVRRALDALVREQLDAERDRSDGVVCTPAQRRAEALVEMAKRAGAVAAGCGAMPRPTLLAICDLGILAGDQGEAAPFGSVCEIDGIGPIPGDTARRLACNAQIFDVTIAADGKVLDVGRSRRLATAAQRKALLVRDQRCVFPGCDREADWCEAHHIDHYEHGGPTDLANLCLLCSRHHHLVHEGRFGLRRQPDGALRFTRPDGSWLHTTRPNHLPLRLPAGARARRRDVIPAPRPEPQPAG
ncbi:MAG: endonuclease [Acidimicrobiales bacterium]|nr:endonuclease [Acidimicrobiales bacterium]